MSEKSLYEQMQEQFGTAKLDTTAPKKEGEVVTVKDLDDLVGAIFKAKEEIEKADAIVSEMNKQLASMKAKAVRYLHDLKREDYSSPLGRIGISQKWRVNMPATDEDKAALFNHLRERGIFDKYATVNANSLNSLYMADWEAAKKSGEGMLFSMPGIGEPKLFEDLSVTKPRTKKQGATNE